MVADALDAGGDLYLVATQPTFRRTSRGFATF